MPRYDRDHGATDAVAMRNLDQLQEQEPHGGASKLGAMVMASFGGACIVFCALTLFRSPVGDEPAPADPLGDLVAASQPAAGAKHKVPPRVDPEDVTFPSVLTDAPEPTTAMAAVRRGGAPRDEDGELPRHEPPPAADSLPVVPLPAQQVLASPPGSVAPVDTLQQMARQVSREPEQAELADAGQPGGYQLQVSSFKSRDEADRFALALRRRGHKAHVEQAHVPNRGVWYRVRIGPFRYKRSAQIYRQEFEAKERMVTFVVDPPKATVRVSLSDNDAAAPRP